MPIREITAEERVRRRADRHGYRLRTSSADRSFDNQGEYMLVDQYGHPLLGDRYEATLEVIEDYLLGIRTPDPPSRRS